MASNRKSSQLENDPNTALRISDLKTLSQQDQQTTNGSKVQHETGMVPNEKLDCVQKKIQAERMNSKQLNEDINVTTHKSNANIILEETSIILNEMKEVIKEQVEVDTDDSLELLYNETIGKLTMDVSEESSLTNHKSLLSYFAEHFDIALMENRTELEVNLSPYLAEPNYIEEQTSNVANNLRFLLNECEKTTMRIANVNSTVENVQKSDFISMDLEHKQPSACPLLVPTVLEVAADCTTGDLLEPPQTKLVESKERVSVESPETKMFSLQQYNIFLDKQSPFLKSGSFSGLKNKLQDLNPANNLHTKTACTDERKLGTNVDEDVGFIASGHEIIKQKGPEVSQITRDESIILSNLEIDLMCGFIDDAKMLEHTTTLKQPVCVENKFGIHQDKTSLEEFKTLENESSLKVTENKTQSNNTDDEEDLHAPGKQCLDTGLPNNNLKTIPLNVLEERLNNLEEQLKESKEQIKQLQLRLNYDEEQKPQKNEERKSLEARYRKVMKLRDTLDLEIGPLKVFEEYFTMGIKALCNQESANTIKELDTLRSLVTQARKVKELESITCTMLIPREQRHLKYYLTEQIPKRKLSKVETELLEDLERQNFDVLDEEALAHFHTEVAKIYLGSQPKKSGTKDPETRLLKDQNARRVTELEVLLLNNQETSQNIQPSLCPTESNELQSHPFKIPVNKPPLLSEKHCIIPDNNLYNENFMKPDQILCKKILKHPENNPSQKRCEPGTSLQTYPKEQSSSNSFQSDSDGPPGWSLLDNNSYVFILGSDVIGPQFARSIKACPKMTQYQLNEENNNNALDNLKTKSISFKRKMGEQTVTQIYEPYHNEKGEFVLHEIIVYGTKRDSKCFGHLIFQDDVKAIVKWLSRLPKTHFSVDEERITYIHTPNKKYDDLNIKNVKKWNIKRQEKYLYVYSPDIAIDRNFADSVILSTKQCTIPKNPYQELFNEAEEKLREGKTVSIYRPFQKTIRKNMFKSNTPASNGKGITQTIEKIEVSLQALPAETYVRGPSYEHKDKDKILSWLKKQPKECFTVA